MYAPAVSPTQSPLLSLSLVVQQRCATTLRWLVDNKINADATQHVGDNETWSCENPLTLKRDLKQRLGFTGWVMSVSSPSTS